MRITPYSFFAIAAAIGLPALAEVDLSKLPPPAAKTDVTYGKDIRPIFEASCFGCHGQEKQKGDLRLDSLEAVLKGGEDGAVIKPGKSAESSLVVAVSGLDEEHAMPPKRKPGGRGPGGPGGFGGPGGERRRGEGPQGDNFQRPPGDPNAKGGPGFGGPGRPGGPGGRMGPMPKPLTTEQISLVRAWIDLGAK